MALVLPTAATGDLVTAIRTAHVRVPLAVVVLDQAQGIQLLSRISQGDDDPADLRSETHIRRAYRLLATKFGSRLRQVLIQPMITGGTELIIGVAQEPVFGPLIVFGLGGVATDILADHTARLAPLTDTDADELIRSIRSAPLLLGHRGSPPADLVALQETLLRISRLADDLPEVTELDLNPVIARPDGTAAVDARIRVAPAQPQDPFLRRLR